MMRSARSASSSAPVSTVTRESLFVTPTISAMLALSLAEVLAVAWPLSSFLPGCSSPVLSALNFSFSVMPETSSMSSLDCRSAVPVISVCTRCSLYEKASAPATCRPACEPPAALPPPALAPPAFWFFL